MGDHPFLAWAHGIGLETEDMSYHLNERHIARQLVDGVNLRAVDILIGIVLQQVAIGADAQLVAEHLLPTRAYAGKVLDILVEDTHAVVEGRISASAICRSKGVVILIFSRLPSTRVMACP